MPLAPQAHDSPFLAAQLRYVLRGGFVFSMFGALYYWVPHFTGRMMSETLGRWAFGLMFGGFALIFAAMQLIGPRGIAVYAEAIGQDRLNMLSTTGAFILAAGISVSICDFFRHRYRGREPGRDPWGAATLEWLYPPKPPGYNFRAIPEIHAREPLWDQPELRDRPAAGIEGALRACPDHRRETIGCHPVSGEPAQILRLPHPTRMPLLVASGLAMLFAATLASLYWLSAMGALLALAGLAAWLWEPSDSGVIRDTGVRAGLRLPVNAVSQVSHLHLGTLGAILIVYALFASLVFAGFYLWNTRPDVALATLRPERIFALLAFGLALAMFAVSWMTGRMALLRAPGRLQVFVNLALGLVVAAMALCLYLALLPVDPYSTAFAALGWVLGAFVAANMGVTFCWALFNALRKLSGMVRPGQGLPDLLLGAFGKATAMMAALTACAYLVAGAPQ